MIIVTGGAGFIGSAVVAELNSRGATDILIVDHIESVDSPKLKNLRPLSYSDLEDKVSFRQKVNSGAMDREKISALIHMGACSSTTETDAEYLLDNNFLYSRDMAEFAARGGIRFLYASSAATYGDGSKGYADDEDRLQELQPLNLYGESKHLFDVWAKEKGVLEKAAGFKFTNVFGPNESHKGEMRSVVNKAYSQVLETGKIKLFKSHLDEYADGEQKRDFIYVKDAVDMVLHFLGSWNPGLYNVGSGRAETWNSLAEAVFDAMDMKPDTEYVEMPEKLKGKYQYYTRAEMAKIRDRGAYSGSARPLKEAVDDYIRNYLVPGRFLGEET